jgi:hypothetical protein
MPSFSTSDTMCLCSLILQLEDGAIVLFLKTIDEDGLEISTPGMCRLGVIRFGSMDTRGGSKET